MYTNISDGYPSAKIDWPPFIVCLAAILGFIATATTGCNGQPTGHYQYRTTRQEVKINYPDPANWFCKMDTAQVDIDFTRQNFSICAAGEGQTRCEIRFMLGDARRVENGDLVTFLEGATAGEVIIFSEKEMKVTHFADYTMTTYFLEAMPRAKLANETPKGWVRLLAEERN